MIYVIYHRSCNDGSAAAAVAYLKFGDQATYRSAHYQEPFHIDINTLTSEDEIYVVDFSYPAEVLDDIIKRVKKLVVLDHHVNTSIMDREYAIYDINKSGASLAWSYFFPDKEMPRFIKLIEDRDLWKFEYEDTSALSEYIRSSTHHKDLHQWVLYFDDRYLDNCLVMGRELVRIKNIKLNNFLRSNKYVIKKVQHDDQTHRVAVFNTTDHISDMADILYRNLDIDYTLSYFIDSNGHAILSFRSSKTSQVDVCKLAKLYGGGGHVNAAGAKINFPESFVFLSNLYRCPTLNNGDKK